MSIFSFLRPKKDPLAAILRDPATKQLMLGMKAEAVSKEAANLRAVGRKDDASQRIIAFLKEIFDEWKRDPYHPSLLTLLANASITCGSPEIGKVYMKSVIEVQAKSKSPFLDLTVPYTDLGRLYHALHDDGQKELWAYHMATQAVPPSGCKHPASKEQKAIAHNFACMCATRINNEEHVKYHDHMRRKLVPDLDWDDMLAPAIWMQSVQAK